LPAEIGDRLGDYASVLTACYALDISVEPRPSMKDSVRRHLDRLAERYPALGPTLPDIEDAFYLLSGTFQAGGKLLALGNGGSAADAGHIVGELMKGFLLPRPLPGALGEQLGDIGSRLQRALPAIDLTQHGALNTAFQNDVQPELCFAQQVIGYGRRGDALLCLSTSGNAPNAQHAARAARAPVSPRSNASASRQPPPSFSMYPAPRLSRTVPGSRRRRPGET